MNLYSMTDRYTLRNRSEIRFTNLKFLLILGSFIFVNPLSATDHVSIDRTARLIQESEQDTALVGKLIRLAKEYGRSKPDSAIHSLEEALKYSRDLGYIKGELSVLIELTITCKNAREYDKALLYGNEGLILSKGLSQPGKEARLLNTMGTVFSRTNHPDSAVIYYYKSLNISLEHNNWLMASKVYNSLGVFFSSKPQANIGEAKRNFLKSYELITQLGDKTALIRAQLNLGNIYGQLEKYDSSNYYLELVKGEVQRGGDLRLQIKILNNIATNKQKQKLFTEALRSYEEILELEKENGNIDNKVEILHNIGVTYKDQGMHSEALPYLLRALELAEKDSLENRLFGIYEALFEAYLGLGQNDSALSQMQKFRKYEKLFNNEQMAQAVQDANANYVASENEKRLILAREEKEARRHERNTFIIVSIFLALLLIFGIMAFNTKQQANRRLSAQKIVIEKKEQEKTLLLRELHHRVKNNLQLISSLLNLQAYQLKDEEAASAVKEGQVRVEAMAMIHRQLYLKEEETKISLQAYLEMMMKNLLYAFGKYAGQVEVDQQVINLDIDADLAIPLGLILNELLTNSLKYAFKNTPNPRLTIKVEHLSQGILLVKVTDNGPGVTGETKRKTSFGMEMVKSLAKQIKAELEINQEGGHVVILKIPYKQSSSDEIMTNYA